jgi:hypothetical protein
VPRSRGWGVRRKRGCIRQIPKRVGYVVVNGPEPKWIRKYVQVSVAAADAPVGALGCAAAPRPLPVMLPVDQTLLQVVRAIKAPDT